MSGILIILSFLFLGFIALVGLLVFFFFCCSQIFGLEFPFESVGFACEFSVRSVAKYGSLLHPSGTKLQNVGNLTNHQGKLTNHQGNLTNHQGMRIETNYYGESRLENIYVGNLNMQGRQVKNRRTKFHFYDS